MTAAVDLGPLLAVAAIGVGLAALPLVWLFRRHRAADPAARLRAIALATLFLAGDLVLLGAFTRLSDSGLGCPDWPGCYGHASPIGAAPHIAAAEAALPSGPVTQGKAWIEMAHRYAAAAIGVLTIALAALAVRESRRGRIDATPAWALATAVWIVVQGAFGALTVTMRLYPAIVTLHLLGGMALLALLAAQAEAYAPEPAARRMAVSPALAAGIGVVGALVVVQLALGGWVSANYAVLACGDFPTCQGAWWPDADFGAGFELRRRLGEGGDGDGLPFPALTAIHLAHRLGAAVVVAAVAWLAWRLLVGARAAAGGAGAAPVASEPDASAAAMRRFAAALVAVCLWQIASGLGNVLLGWPLAAAVAHTAGGAALVVVWTMLAMRVGRPADAMRSATASAANRPGRPAALAPAVTRGARP